MGSHTITATFSGTAGWGSSSGNDIVSPQVVNPDATATSISSSVNPSVFGRSVTFTATVTVNVPGAGTPTGTVTFEDGTTTLGTGTLSGGTATFSTSSSSRWATSITASYGGDTDDAGSSSSPVSQDGQPEHHDQLLGNPRPIPRYLARA